MPFGGYSHCQCRHTSPFTQVPIPYTAFFRKRKSSRIFRSAGTVIPDDRALLKLRWDSCPDTVVEIVLAIGGQFLRRLSDPRCMRDSPTKQPEFICKLHSCTAALLCFRHPLPTNTVPDHTRNRKEREGGGPQLEDSQNPCFQRRCKWNPVLNAPEQHLIACNKLTISANPFCFIKEEKGNLTGKIQVNIIIC